MPLLRPQAKLGRFLSLRLAVRPACCVYVSFSLSLSPSLYRPLGRLLSQLRSPACLLSDAQLCEKGAESLALGRLPAAGLCCVRNSRTATRTRTRSLARKPIGEPTDRVPAQVCACVTLRARSFPLPSGVQQRQHQWRSHKLTSSWPRG